METPLLRNNGKSERGSRDGFFSKAIIMLMFVAVGVFILSREARMNEEADLHDVAVGEGEVCDYGSCELCLQDEKRRRLFGFLCGGCCTAKPKQAKMEPKMVPKKGITQLPILKGITPKENVLQPINRQNAGLEQPKRGLDRKNLVLIRPKVTEDQGDRVFGSLQDRLNGANAVKLQTARGAGGDKVVVREPQSGGLLDACNGKEDAFCQAPQMKLICVKGGLDDKNKRNFGGCSGPKERGPPFSEYCCDKQSYTTYFLLYTEHEFRMKNRAMMVRSFCSVPENNCETVSAECETMRLESTWLTFVRNNVKISKREERFVVVAFGHGSNQDLSQGHEHRTCGIRSETVIDRMIYLNQKIKETKHNVKKALFVTSACFSGYLREAVINAGYPFPVVATEGRVSHYSRNMDPKNKKTMGWGNGASDLALRVLALDVNIYHAKPRVGFFRESRESRNEPVTVSSGSSFITGARQMISGNNLQELLLPTPGYQRLAVTGSLKFRYKVGDVDYPGFAFRDYGLDPKWFVIRIKSNDMCLGVKKNADETLIFKIGNADVELHYFMNPVVCPEKIHGYQVIDTAPGDKTVEPTKYLIKSTHFTCQMNGRKRISITRKANKCSPSAQASQEVFLELVYDIETLFDHQKQASACTTHEECGNVSKKYCFDYGKYSTNEWSGFGQCSTSLKDCCWDGDADPVDQDTAKCPVAAQCSQENSHDLRSSDESFDLESHSSDCTL